MMRTLKNVVHLAIFFSFSKVSWSVVADESRKVNSPSNLFLKSTEYSKWRNVSRSFATRICQFLYSRSQRQFCTTDVFIESHSSTVRDLYCQLRASHDCSRPVRNVNNLRKYQIVESRLQKEVHFYER